MVALNLKSKDSFGLLDAGDLRRSQDPSYLFTTSIGRFEQRARARSSELRETGRVNGNRKKADGINFYAV